jgi:hypothetical protein
MQLNWHCLNQYLVRVPHCIARILGHFNGRHVWRGIINEVPHAAIAQ